jgi:hypothetical protein
MNVYLLRIRKEKFIFQTELETLVYQVIRIFINFNIKIVSLTNLIFLTVTFYF